MDLLFVATSVFFFTWVVRNSLFWLWVWQKNEYRLDLLRIYLFRTTHGRDILISFPLMLKLLGIILYIPVVLTENLADLYHVLVFFIFLLDTVFFLREIFTNTIKIPTLTFRLVLIIIPAVFIISLFYYYPIVDSYLWLLLLDRFLLVVLTIAIFALSFPSEVHRDLQITKAKKKLQRRDLFTVAVTGAIGKYASVYTIQQVIGSKMSAFRTHAGPNTIHRIASVVRKEMQDGSEAFVSQIDSEKTTELYEVLDFLHPRVVVMQGRYSENAKNQYDALLGFPQTSLVVTEFGTPAMRKLLQQVIHKYAKVGQKKTLMFFETTSSDGGTDSENVLQAKNIVLKKESITFDIVSKKTTYHYHAPLLGRQAVSYILPAIPIAKYIGFTYQEIKQAVSHLLPLDHHMIPYRMASGAVIIDDSHPTEAISVRSALEYMRIYSGKKILVLTPISTINKHTAAEHYALAKEIATTCDYLFLTNRYFSRQFVKGFYESGGGCIIKYGSRSAIASFIASQLKTKEDIALLEGEDTRLILPELLKRFR